MSSSRLEQQYHEMSGYDGFGQSEPGFNVYDYTAAKFVAPQDVGLQFAPEQLVEGLADNGADESQLRYGTLCLYEPGAIFPCTTGPIGKSVHGFVNENTVLADADGGLRFPVIYLRADKKISQDRLNATLWHEGRHLLQPSRKTLYNREALTVSLRAGSLLSTATLASMLPDFYNDDRLFSLLGETGMSYTSANAVGAAVTAAAIASGFLSTMLHHQDTRGGLLSYFDSQEIDANRFARQQRKVQPLRRT